MQLTPECELLLSTIVTNKSFCDAIDDALNPVMQNDPDHFRQTLLVHVAEQNYEHLGKMVNDFIIEAIEKKLEEINEEIKNE